METLKPYGWLCGTEYASDALPWCRELLGAESRLVQSSATELPFAASSFDLVTAFDVLEHIADDVTAATEIHRILRRDGTFLCTVPAHPWLWSEFDEYSGHQRRYTAAALRRLLTEADFEIQRMFYFNAVLFVPVVIVRFMKNVADVVRNSLGAGGDRRVRGTGLGMPPSLVNKALSEAFGMEARWVPRFDIPFGVSLVCIVRKGKSWSVTAESDKERTACSLEPARAKGAPGNAASASAREPNGPGIFAQWLGPG